MHEGGGLKPAAQRRVELLEDKSKSFNNRINENQKQVDALRTSLTEIKDWLFALSQECKTLATVHDDTLVEVASLSTNLGAFSEQSYHESSQQLQSEVSRIENMVLEIEDDLRNLNNRTTTVQGQINSLHGHVERNEELQETTWKRLKVSEESYQSIKAIVGSTNPLGPSLTQKIESQNSTITAIGTRVDGSVENTNRLDSQVHVVFRKIDKLFDHVSTLFDKYRDVASRAGSFPNLSSRVLGLEKQIGRLKESLATCAPYHWVESQVQPVKRSLASCIDANNQRWNTWRPRIRALEEDRQLTHQVAQKLLATQGNVSQLESSSNEMREKVHALEQSQQNDQLHSHQYSELVQKIQGHIQYHLGREKKALQKQQEKTEEEMDQRLLAHTKRTQEKITFLEAFQAQSIGRVEETIRSLEKKVQSLQGSVVTNHETNTQRLSSIEADIDQVKERQSQTMTYASSTTSDQSTIYRNGYVRWLRGLDFRLQDGMKGYKDRLVRVDDHLLFSCENQDYFVKRFNRFSTEPSRAQRDQCGLIDDAYESEERLYCEFAYRHSGFEAIYIMDKLKGGLPHLPQYMVCLGEVYVHGQQKGTSRKQVTSTGFYLFMDITAPGKSLWIIFPLEAPNRNLCDDTSFLLGDQYHMFNPLVNKRFDIAMIAESVHDWNITDGHSHDEPQLDFKKVQSCMEKSAVEAGTMFTYPHLESLFQKIEFGWREFPGAIGAPTS